MLPDAINTPTDLSIFFVLHAFVCSLIFFPIGGDIVLSSGGHSGGSADRFTHAYLMRDAGCTQLKKKRLRLEKKCQISFFLFYRFGDSVGKTNEHFPDFYSTYFGRLRLYLIKRTFKYNYSIFKKIIKNYKKL